MMVASIIGYQLLMLPLTRVRVLVPRARREGVFRDRLSNPRRRSLPGYFPDKESYSAPRAFEG